MEKRAGNLSLEANVTYGHVAAAAGDDGKSKLM